MRRLVLLSLTLACLAAPLAAPAQASPQLVAQASAGSDPDSAQREQEWQQKLQSELGINQGQAQQVQSILQSEHQQIQALGAQATAEQREAIHQQAEAQLSQLLTPDQLNKLKELRHHHGGHRR